MKKLIIISLISLLLPFFSLAQVIVNQPYHYNLSNSDGLNSLTKPGGKKKKPAPKKDAKADPKKENKQDVKNEAVKSTKKDPKKGKKAQKKQKKEVSDYDWNFFAGPDMAFAFPLGRLRDSVNNGVGFNVRAEYFYTPELKLVLWTGYKSCKYDPVMVGVGHFTYIPIKLAATYYFSDGAIRPYANFGLGLYLIRQKYDAEFWTIVRNPQTNKVDTIY